MSNNPVIEVIPERPLLIAGKEQTIDLLIRVHPPELNGKSRRPQLNLSVVLDRSGSMQGEKIIRARQSACYLIDQLLPQDRISVVIFDDVIDLLVPSRPADNKEQIKEMISRIQARNSTALHEAWVRGGIQVSEHLTQGAINRVILITDGLANVGETNSDRIVSQAGELAARGVSTSTIGIGRDFNEDLLIPMAEAGRGNAWQTVEPSSLERIFATELEGLIAQVGHTVSLGLTPNEGVKVQDVLNDFDVTHTGRYKLPNLRVGSPIDVVIKVKAPARREGERYRLLDLRLAWNPQQAPVSQSPAQKITNGDRQVLTQSIAVEYTGAGLVEQTRIDERVTKAVQLLMAARARREAMEHLDHGDFASARLTVAESIQSMYHACARLASDEDVQEQIRMLNELEEDLKSQQDTAMARKKMSYQSYYLRQSKTLK